jgi:hypothetical protein
MRYLLPAVALLGLCAGCVQPPPPPPPPEMVSDLAASIAPGNPNCREYTTHGTVNGQQQPVVGRACRQPDGTWRLEDEEEDVFPEIIDLKSSPSADNPSCRDYSATAIFDGRQQPVVGRACALPNGFWQVTQGTPEQPVQTSIVYPPPPPDDPYYYAGYYDPWFWGPPFIGFGGEFVFVDRDHHHHGFGGHGHWGGRGGHGGGHGGHGGGGGHH